jgi:phosphonate transport system substrate-binding protein
MAKDLQSPGPIRFAPLSMEGKKILREQFYGLVDYLEEALGREVELVEFLDYADLLQAFHEDRVDLVFLGPLPYSLLVGADEGVEPISCFRESDGSNSYTCSLVMRGSEPVDLAHDAQMHIGLTQPYSTCGYLAVSLMLREVGRSIEEEAIRYSYAGNHSAAALGVARGVYELAGVKSAVAERYRHLDLQILGQSRPFPGFGLYANRRQLSQQTLLRLHEAMQKLDPTHSQGARGLARRWGGILLDGTSDPSHCGDPSLMRATEGWPPGWSESR